MDNSRRQTRNAGGGMKYCESDNDEPKKALKRSEDSESEASESEASVDFTPAALKRSEDSESEASESEASDDFTPKRKKKKTTATKISDEPKRGGALKRSEDSESEASDDDDFTSAALKQTRQECEQKKSTFEVKPANLPLRQSDVPLIAAPLKGAGRVETETLKNKAALEELEDKYRLKNKAALEELEDKYRPETEKLKNDLEEVDEKMEGVDEDFEEVEENMDDADRKIEEAFNTLAAAKNKFTPHDTAKPLLKALQGGNALAKIGPDDTAASEMQQLTNTSLEKSDVTKASWNLKNNPSETNGDFAYWKRGTKTTTNKNGKTVSKNASLVNKAKWKYMEEKNMGLPKYLAEKSHNLLDKIVRYADLIPHVLGCGEDYFLIAEEPESWDKDKSLVDFVAQLFGYPNWSDMHPCLIGDLYELGGMSSVRFIGNDILPWKGRNNSEIFKRAGYIFTFKDGNSTRFDTSGLLSDLAKKTPSKEECLSKYTDDTFSVEKIDGDNTFGIKTFRTQREMVSVIGSRFRKKKDGKFEHFKKHHMPSVGKAKSFETQEGVFTVTRLKD